MNVVNEVKCSGPGCPEVFRSVEPFAKDVRYTCRNHTGKVEVKSPPAFQHFSHESGALSTARDPIAYLQERDIDEKEN